ncbi:hypothetical protein NEMBOFW57_008932 [Staphylotrichum longicolle]|uniref:Uncharacterized protein n=1 Tax=Staphylotrichum longicolle TaxID=669026 RepID=A0AAD4HX37_9PEZI|nr:hypothetical protein NEMBOFW57_008932 [Staphylotrichum longicolle]
MGWELSTWLALARSFQLLASLAATSMHGYLTVRVYSGRLGLSKEMVVLELFACILLGYSILAIFGGRRSNKTGWLTFFIVCDVVMCAILLGIITTLSHAGLPVHCAGMTRITDPNEKYSIPGYTTIGFSDESLGQRGQLDTFCGFDRSYFAIANALIFAYMFTITVTVLRILEKKYTKNTKVNEVLESLQRADDINMKVVDTPSPLDSSPSLNLPLPPSSEGILTRNTSLRSTFTAATSAAASHAGSYGHDPIPRRPIGHPHAAPITRRPLPPLSPPPSTPVNNPSVAAATAGFVPVPLDEEDSDAEAALVADGMQHHRPPHHHHQYQQQHQHHRHHPPHNQPHPHHPSSPPPFPHGRMSMSIPMPMLSEEDAHSAAAAAADAALVSDGMRPSEPMLPPYHPGHRRMSGHAEGEDNEMRLSGYVKGQTRAQDMKDSGRY